MKLTFLDLRARLSNKLIEQPFIWIYGSRERAKIELKNFSQRKHLSNDEAIRQFCNADFWEAFVGKKEGKEINLLSIFKNLRNPDLKLLHSKITNPEQIALLMKAFETRKTPSGLKVFSWFINKKISNKGRIISEFGITNETLVNWLQFIKRHQTLPKVIDPELKHAFADKLGEFEIKGNKLTLLECCALYIILDHENPVDQKTFTKGDLCKILFPVDKDKYKAKYVTYEIAGEIIRFKIFPFSLFKMLRVANGYDYSDEAFRGDWKNRDN